MFCTVLKDAPHSAKHRAPVSICLKSSSDATSCKTPHPGHGPPLGHEAHDTPPDTAPSLLFWAELTYRDRSADLAMRLINTRTLELEDFVDHTFVPSYAILSHTWEDGEITLQEWHDLEFRAKKKKGFFKIQSTCQQALLDGYSHAWVDTNCIDKSSSAELSESINSMFNWYRGADICYVYMADVPPHAIKEDYCDPDSHFRKSRWFTRGWTLQELIAPIEMKFYALDWTTLGVKRDLVQALHEATGIDNLCLSGDLNPSDFSSAEVMSWAAYRVTTRLEDQAYCLLGLFGVNMPLLYGEGRKAFLRLQEEIIKTSDDQSIFVCDIEALAMIAPLCTNPALFARSRGIERLSRVAAPMATIPPFYSTTNAGLSITLPLIETLSPGFVLGVLNCHILSEQPSGHICLPLSSHVSDYRHQYTRVSLPAAWITLSSASIRPLLPWYEDNAAHPENWSSNFVPEEPTSIMVSQPHRYDYDYLTQRILGPVQRMGARVFFFVIFPHGFSGYRLYAADPPEALDERTNNMGRSLLVFKERGSGRGSGKYVGVYLEAALSHEGAAGEWPRACQTYPNWQISQGVSAVAPSNDQFPRGRSSWVGDVLVAVRTAMPVESSYLPGTSIVLLAEIIFDMGRYSNSRGRKGSMNDSNLSFQQSLMLRDSDDSDRE
ncbi:HET domain-containing protein [Colletotrichum tofieldiae]|uniref:HET domain-containing protein n=1 Tax=Colletotrichum tofieldiae TaxID=708197 RepID=A0A161WGB4_9PEZI|nr:HET domain-containing protein [Colletotrichum tofieldiae]